MELQASFKVPNTFADIVNFAKIFAKGWKKRADGTVVCTEGRCTLGAILRLKNGKDAPKFPYDLSPVGIPQSLAGRIMTANDLPLKEQKSKSAKADRRNLLKILGLPKDKE